MGTNNSGSRQDEQPPTEQTQKVAKSSTLEQHDPPAMSNSVRNSQNEQDMKSGKTNGPSEGKKSS